MPGKVVAIVLFPQIAYEELVLETNLFMIYESFYVPVTYLFLITSFGILLRVYYDQDATIFQGFFVCSEFESELIRLDRRTNR